MSTFSLSSLVGGHLGGFQILVAMTKATVHMIERVFLWQDDVSFMSVPKVV